LVAKIVSVENMSPELELAISAARQAGALLRENYETDLVVDELKAHDIKLNLDVRCQDLITDCILASFPDHAIYGEEGLGGNQDSDKQWIVDPLDGTVNYFYAIPHFCVSIALRVAGELKIGVIYEPMRDELFAVDFDGPATLNGTPITPSDRAQLAESMMTIGFSKTEASIEAGLQRYKRIAFRVRKTRMMGSAALSLAYIACGRIDAYVEERISLWDIAAGQLLVERSGGIVTLSDSPGAPDKHGIVAYNGKLPMHEIL
ncbi:MAG: inositol monophosphatase family protein, partial [Verrucomicrobiota bacterium]